MAPLMSLKRSENSTMVASRSLRPKTMFSETHGPESRSRFTSPSDTARTQRPSQSRRAATSKSLRAQRSTVPLMAPWMSLPSSELSMPLERETSVETMKSGLTHGKECQRLSQFLTDNVLKTRPSLSESTIPSLFHEREQQIFTSIRLNGRHYAVSFIFKLKIDSFEIHIYNPLNIHLICSYYKAT